MGGLTWPLSRTHAENHADVLDGRGDGGGEEAAVGVERPHGEGAQTHQGQVRKHDAREQRGQRSLFGIAREARRHHTHDPRGEDEAERRSPPRAPTPSPRAGPQHARGVRAGALRSAYSATTGTMAADSAPSPEQPPEHVGDAVGHEEGVRRHPGPEGEGDDHVPGETEDPAEECRAPHGGERAQDLALDAVAVAHLAIPGSMRHDDASIRRRPRGQGRARRGGEHIRWRTPSRESSGCVRTSGAARATAPCARNCAPR